MVEDHVGAVGHTASVSAARAGIAHTEADIADDKVVGAGERHAVAVDLHALSGSGLAKDGVVALHYERALDVDDACYVEDDDAARFAYGVAE